MKNPKIALVIPYTSLVIIVEWILRRGPVSGGHVRGCSRQGSLRLSSGLYLAFAGMPLHPAMP